MRCRARGLISNTEMKGLEPRPCSISISSRRKSSDAAAATVLTVVREIMLHGFAGILWGYLYWRYGLVAAMIGHISAHVSLWSSLLAADLCNGHSGPSDRTPIALAKRLR